jgi:hypothetical protein
VSNILKFHSYVSYVRNLYTWVDLGEITYPYMCSRMVKYCRKEAESYELPPVSNKIVVSMREKEIMWLMECIKVEHCE